MGNANIGRTYRVLATEWRDKALTRVSLEALGLDRLAGAYCADNLTDGHISAACVLMIAAERNLGAKAQKTVVSALVREGLWVPEHDGFRIVGYPVANITKAGLASVREANATRKQNQRIKAKQTVTNGHPADVTVGQQMGRHAGQHAGHRGGTDSVTSAVTSVPGPWSHTDLKEKGDLDLVARGSRRAPDPEPPPGVDARSQQQILLDLRDRVRVAFEQRYLDALTVTPSWNASANAALETLTQWLVANAPRHRCEPEQLIPRLLRKFFADPKMPEKRFPIQFLANSPAEYFEAAGGTNGSAPSDDSEAAVEQARLREINEQLNEARCNGAHDDVDRLEAEKMQLGERARARKRTRKGPPN